MQYEIEIKSLLGSKAASDELLRIVTERDPSTRLVSEQHQLNHYFKAGSLRGLVMGIGDRLSVEQRLRIEEIADTATSANVRTRQKNDDVLLIVKGSLDEVSSVHSHQRMEFEASLSLGLAELDDEVIKSGWQLEAKWQADRKIYETMGLTLDLFFTPGYGYMAEFEKVVHTDADRTSAHQQLVDAMYSLGVEELPSDRLECMFAYYNEHWADYYGTDKVFTID